MRASVLHVSTSDIEGGSARSAWRIHTGLLARGLPSRMLVGTKSSDSADVLRIARTNFSQRADHWSARVTSKLGLQYCFIPTSRHLGAHEWVRSSDVIQLYNLHGGYFDLAALVGFRRQAQLVWRLSDMWPVTGHCAYSGSCERWQVGCGNCPDLDAYPAVGLDFTRHLWLRKQRLYRSLRPFTVVAPSSWIETVARRSPLFSECEIIRIPNGINTSRYAPKERAQARERLGIRDDRPAILFVAHVAFDNPRKGTGDLAAALRALSDPSRCCLIVAGRDSERWIGHTPVDAHPLGFVTDEDGISDLYGAADIVVVPSTVENLPNTVLEALSSGRAIVAYGAGGMADAVRDGETGICLPVGGEGGLARALEVLLGDPALRARLASNARDLAEREFRSDLEIDRFARLHEKLATDRPRI